MAIGLSSGQIAATIGAIYTAGATGSSIKSILIHNTNTTTESVIISIVVNNGGAVGTAADADKIFAEDIAANETYELSLGYPIVLSAENDTVQASTTTASKVNYIVSGVIN